MEADLWPGSHNKLIIRSKRTCATDDKPPTSGLLDPRRTKNRRDFAAAAPPAEGSDRSATVRPGTRG
jgi:hypothetical protein